MFDHFHMYPEGAFQPRGGKGRSMRLHGGKGGSSAPPPDPRLTEAQIRSMGIQDRSIERIVANSDRIAPLQEEEMRSGITRGNIAWNQSQEDRTYGLERRGRLTGLQNRMLEDADSFNAGDRREELAGQAQADVTTAFQGQREMNNRGLQRMGVNPGSGRALAAMTGLGVAEAAAKATAANKTRQAARLEGYQLNDRAANAFSGYPASTAGSVGTGLNTAGFGLQQANSGLAGQNSGYGAAGQLGGQLGSNATGMWGQQANYKSQQDRLASDNDPFRTILGAAAGIGTRAALSDRRAKTSITAVGSLPNGLTVYTYRYKTGGPVQMGVMADEVAVLAPHAFIRGINGQYDRVDYGAL